MSQSKRPEIIVDEIIEDRTQHLQHPQQSLNPFQPQPQTKRYRRGRYLGKGGFAKVYAFQSLNSGREYACKVIPKASLIKESARRKLMNEIDIHRSIAHERVVRFERFFEDKANVYIILELCQGQSMLELVKRRGALSEVETQYYIWHLLAAIQHLHSALIIHRDLKLGNLFLDHHGSLKVGDFGLATRLEHADERKRTVCGTPNYIAPEILDNSHGHSFEVDVWAIGVIMYTLLFGQPPFETESVKTTYKRIKDNHYAFPLPSHKQYKPVSAAAKSLIRRILCTDPSRRPTVKEMREDVFFSQSPVVEGLGIEVHERPMGRGHACQAAIDEEERRDREDERRAKEKLARAAAEDAGEAAEEEENEQENAAVRQSDKAASRPAERRAEDAKHKRASSREHADRDAAQPQQQQAAARTILGEKAVNDAPVRLGKRAEASKSPEPTGQSLASRKDRVEALEKEKEEIVSRLKARSSSASPQPPSAGAPSPVSSPQLPAAATASVASPTAAASLSAAFTTLTTASTHHFFHTPATTARALTVPSAPIAMPTSPYRRTLSSGQLTISPSIRRSMSAIPVLSAMPSAPISASSTPNAASPPSSAASSPSSATSIASHTSASRPALSARVMPSPFAAKPLVYRFVPNTDPAATASAATPATTPTAAASSASKSPAAVVSPPPTPTASLPLSDSLSAVVSIVPEREREADALRRASDERVIRAELEAKLKEEQQKLRAAQSKAQRSVLTATATTVATITPATVPAAAMTATATVAASTSADSALPSAADNKRVTRGMLKKRMEEDEEKSPLVDHAIASDSQRKPLPAIAPAGHSRARSSEIDTLASSLTAVSLGAPAPASAAGAAHTLPCVMEESFLATADVSGSSLPPPALYLDKWVDYSSKYGLAYLLSDGRVGVYFNDSTRAVLLGRGNHCTRFLYMERRGSGDSAVEYDMEAEGADWPAGLVKKVTLIRHFQKYLASYTKLLPKTAAAYEAAAAAPVSESPHVRRWLRTKHAILFRLSTGQVQVVFNDMTELIIDPPAHSSDADGCDGAVHFTDRSKKRHVCEVEGGQVVGGGERDGLDKSLRYVREVLAHMRGRSRLRERGREERRERGAEAAQDEKAVHVHAALDDDKLAGKKTRAAVPRRS